MTNRTIKIFLYVLCVALTVSCSTPNSAYQKIQNIPMLGTSLTIIADIHADSIPSLLEAIEEVDTNMKAQMSIFDPTSLVSRINRGETDSLTADMIYNIRLADSVSRVSEGFFDITVMPLVEAWGFARKEAAVAEPNIDSLLEFVGFTKISIKDGKLVKQDPRTKLDFNAIAKGYTVDCLAQRVADLGATNYLVDIGGEINCQGVNATGNAWRVGVESPIDGNMSDGDYLQKRIEIKPENPLRGVATSGNYRRFYISESGEKIAHTINPATGRSQTSTLLSATVFAPTCALADAYATMFMAAGGFNAQLLSKEIEGIEVYFIFSGNEHMEYREYMTPGLKSMLSR